MKFIPYLMFEGNAEEAVNFYAKVFQGTIVGMMRYSENPEMTVENNYKDKVLHSEIQVNGESIYMSDCFPGETVSKGDQASIFLEFDSLEEIERVYVELSEGVDVFMEIHDSFWGSRFASFVDKFGIAWSLSYAYPEA